MICVHFGRNLRNAAVLDALRKFVSVRSSGSDDSLFMVSDKRTAALDQSLSELNLVSLLEGDRWVSLRIYSKLTLHSRTLRAFVHAIVCLGIHSKLTGRALTHRTNTEVVWRTISDFQKDPYTTGLSIFSKITDKILFRSVQNKVKL